MRGSETGVYGGPFEDAETAEPLRWARLIGQDSAHAPKIDFSLSACQCGEELLLERNQNAGRTDRGLVNYRVLRQGFGMLICRSWEIWLGFNVSPFITNLGRLCNVVLVDRCARSPEIANADAPGGWPTPQGVPVISTVR